MHGLGVVGIFWEGIAQFFPGTTWWKRGYQRQGVGGTNIHDDDGRDGGGWLEGRGLSERVMYCSDRVSACGCVCVCALWNFFSRLGLAGRLSMAGLVMKSLLLVAYFFLLPLFVLFSSTYLDWQMAMALGC